MESVGYYNGEMGAPEDLRVPFLDRANYFGDGVYDGAMARDGVILFEDEHLARFEDSLAVLRIDVPWTRAWLSGELHRVLDQCSVRDTFVYWQVTRGTAPRDHTFPAVEPNLWITVTPHPFSDLSKTIDVASFEDKRFSYCNAKTLNLIPNVLAAQHALERGCQEAVFVRDGYVTESAHSNIHILVKGTLVTHPADDHILPGIARRHLLDMCATLGIPVEERLYTLDELMAADEVVVSASSTFGIRVAHVDGVAVGGRDQATYERLCDALNCEFEDYIATHTKD